MIDLNEKVDFSKVSPFRTIDREGFIFTSITYPANVYDAIVIKYPRDIRCFSAMELGSKHSLETQINLINNLGIEKALIIAEDLEFITRCPTLKHLRVIPPDNVGNGFDYSPLYRMPQIISLRCSTVYGYREENSTLIDCSKIKGLESIHVTNTRYKNFQSVKTLKDLEISHYGEQNLSNAFDSFMIDTLSIFQCKIKTLEGIEKSENMQCLYLYYNRSLKDITALGKVKKTLRALRIENCPKIEDFSILGELENLELLELSGSNVLPDLNFLKKMKSLKTFVFTMNVQNGDLSPCLSLSYVYSGRNRKHYNLKDSELPKGSYFRGNDNIDEWRKRE